MKFQKKLYSIILSLEKNKILFFFFLLLLATLLEGLSVSIIYPILSFAVNYESSEYFNLFSENFSIFSNFSKVELIIISLIFFVFIYLVKSLYLVFFSWWRNSFIYNFEKQISLQLYEKYLNLNVDNFYQINSAAFIRNIVTESKKVRRCVDVAFRLLIEIFAISIIAFILLVIEPVATISSFIFFSIFGILINKFFRHRLLQLAKKLIFHTEKIFQNLREGFGSFKEIKLRKNQSFFLDRFNIDMGGFTNVVKMQTFFSETVRIFIEFLAVIFLCILTIFLIYYYTDLKNILPTLALFGAAAFRFFPAVNRIIQSIQVIQSSEPSIDLLYNDLKINNFSSIKKGNENSNIRNKIVFEKEIEFKNITYRYPNSKTDVIKNLNFKIKKNDFICIYGGSGKGKTTFVDILSGLLEPNSGKILVDGREIKNNLDKWRTNIAYVPQSVYLFDDTIKNNILFQSSKSFDQNKLNYAIQSSQLQTFVNRQKDGLNYKVGDSGAKLSGGQIQRVGIARSLYLSPNILICDEITSSLDKQTESNIVSCLKSLSDKITIIFVTHRPSIFEDKIPTYLLDNDSEKNSVLKRIGT